MANNNNGMEVSKGVLMAIIAVLVLILLFAFVPGLRALFTKDGDKSRSGGSAPVNLRVNGETVRTTSGSDRTTTSQGAGKDSAIDVNVDETDDGTTINIDIPEDVDVHAEGTPGASVGPLPNL